MRGRFILLAATLLALAGMAATAEAGEVLDRITKAKKIVNAVDPEYPPFSSMGPNNKLEGFDIDVAAEFAKRLGVEIETVTPGWDIITAGHWAGRWDLCLASMTATKERGEVLDFPANYYYGQAVILVNKDNTTITGPKDLSGKKVGVQVSTTYEKYLQKNLEVEGKGAAPITYDFDKPQIVSFDAEPTGVDDLALGDGKRLDAMVVSILTAQDYIKSGKPLKVVGKPLFYEPISVAIDKGDPELAAKVKEIIDSMYADGTLKKLSMDRFGVDITAPPAAM
jgi:polar amino acid transport system substrate-binding protein